MVSVRLNWQEGLHADLSDLCKYRNIMPIKTTLPKLLAGLPKHGRDQLVQPVSWQTKYPNSFYKITRTKLRFRPIEEGGNSASIAASTDKGKAKEVARDEDEFDEDNEDDGDIFGSLAEEEDVTQQGDGRPHGKAWGVLFWNGESERVNTSWEFHRVGAEWHLPVSIYQDNPNCL